MPGRKTGREPLPIGQNRKLRTNNHNTMNHYTGTDYLMDNGNGTFRTENDHGVIEDGLTFEQAKDKKAKHGLEYLDIVSDCKTFEDYKAIDTELQRMRRLYSTIKERSKFLKSVLTPGQAAIAEAYNF